MRNAPQCPQGLSQSDWGWIISTKKVGAANAVPTFFVWRYRDENPYTLT